ncbi:MAG: hypothetical protein ACT4NY_12745 [Pseudonocardiales bacterium]
MSFISSVQISAWAQIDDDAKIKYRVDPNTDTAEFDIAGYRGLGLEMNEVCLRRFIAVFTEALDEFTAAATEQPESTPSEHGVEPV